jgi:predicted transcriptional regulator
MKNRENLIKLMNHYRVDVKTVGELLGLAPSTVRIYRTESGNQITDKDLELLEYKLQEHFKIQ